MKQLGLDGALGGFSAALAHDDRVLATACAPGTVALERGLQLVAHVLAEGGCEGEGLDRIGVGCGPGGFTGLRIVLSYAKSLAIAWKVPLVALSSFDLLEFGLPLEAAAARLTVVEGRPGVISARLLGSGKERRASGRIGHVLDELFASPVDALTAVGAPKDVLAALAERGMIVRPCAPFASPAAVAAALLAAQCEPAESAHAVRADYGELPAAKVPAR